MADGANAVKADRPLRIAVLRTPRKEKKLAKKRSKSKQQGA